MEITYKLQSYRGTQLEVEPNVDGAVIEILVVKIEKAIRLSHLSPACFI